MLRNLRLIKTNPISSLLTSTQRIRYYSSDPINTTNTTTEVKSDASINALLARLNINFTDKQIIEQVITHKSYLLGKTSTNDRLRYLGKKVLGLYLSEYYYIKYPNLPVNTIEDILRVHYDPYALSKIGQGFGLAPLIRYKEEQSEGEQIVGFNKILGKSVQALIGAIYHDKGAVATKEFIHQHLLSKEVDVNSLLPLATPKKSLVSLLKIKNKPEPVSRLLKETGRLSNRPVFVVGVYSGDVKLGESYGSSLKMAEFRACKDALIRYYLTELKDFQLPSDTLEEDELTFFPTKISDAPSRI
ncbi:ribonuclease III [Neoconidiobolus thromboides FSU 785]|nr:ribonuclease III [Neoconidiobolus thromboides FSU 785]